MCSDNKWQHICQNRDNKKALTTSSIRDPIPTHYTLGNKKIKAWSLEYYVSTKELTACLDITLQKLYLLITKGGKD